MMVIRSFAGTAMSEHRLAAVMVTDMVGFTAMMGADQNNALRLLNRGHDLLKSIVAEHHGEWFEDAGDRSITAFPSAIDAVNCARQIQAQVHGENGLELRIGVDVGDVIVSGDHIYGDAVNIASFIERLADPNGLVISESVYQAVQNDLNLNVVDLGEKMLKNISHPVRLYKLSGSKKQSRVENWLTTLVARRVPHILGAYLAGSWAVIEVTDWLTDHELIGQQWAFVMLVGLLALTPSVILFAYTHGAHGRDNYSNAEKFGIPLNILLAFLLVVLVYQDVEVHSDIDPLQPASVAVLPFINLGDGVDGNYFRLGLSEELINALARVPGLYVASRTSSFLFDSNDRDPRAIARDLRVATILEGSVRMDGDRVRVTAQLIDGNNNFHLWSDTFDRDLADKFLIQEEIATAVAFNLVGILQPDLQIVLADARTSSTEAHQYFLQGLSYLRQPPTSETLGGARRLLNLSISFDPDYALAHAGLCQLELEQYVLDRSASAIDAAETECVKALQIDARSREVKQALGELYRHTGDYEKSERIFRDMIAEITTPDSLVGLGRTLDAKGDVVAAEELFQQAIAMEPGNWHHSMVLAEFFYWHCRYAEAELLLRDVIRLSPDNVRAHLILGAAYNMQGDAAAALQETGRAIEIAPTRGAYRDMGWTYHFLGEYENAVVAYQQALQLGPNDYATWGSLGDTYAQMKGERDAALLAYARALVLGEDLLARNPRDDIIKSNLAVYNVLVGAVDKGVAWMNSALESRPSESKIHFSNAIMQVLLKNDEQALDALEHAVGLGCYPQKLINDDPRFARLKNNERFQKLVSNLGEKK
jgi:TolB-like protein/class 3 adenylate cyclase/Flp pilus assembly protein TadD